MNGWFGCQKNMEPMEFSLEEALRQAAAARALFGDAQAVRGFETFLIAAVDAAARGERRGVDGGDEIPALPDVVWYL